MERLMEGSENVKEALLQCIAKSDTSAADGVLPLLRTFSRPVSKTPFFDVQVETEHAWPSSNLLNGGGCCKVHYRNGAHLVSSGNRLLVVRQDNHFYFPPWGSLIQDAYIQRCGADKRSLIIVGLVNGIHAALLQEESPPVVLDDIFIETGRSVEKIVSFENGKLTLCYGNAQVESCRLVFRGDKVSEMVLSSNQRPRRIYDAVISLWDTKRYQDSAYDPYRGNLFVLSNTDLAVWKRTLTGEFVVAGSVAVLRNTVTVLASFETSHHAVLIAADGGRQPVLLDEAPAAGGGTACVNVRLASSRPLPSGLHVEDIRFACRDTNGTTLLYDALTHLLILITTNCAVYEGVYDEMELVSTFHLDGPITGIGYVSESVRFGTSFVVYGGSGIQCRIGALPIGLVTANLLKLGNPHDEIFSSLLKLGGRRGMEALVGANLAGVPAETLAPLLGQFLHPFPQSNNMRVAPGAEGLLYLVHRQIVVAERLWTSPFSWDLALRLEGAVKLMEEWRGSIESLLRLNGWLDYPVQHMGLVWQGFVVSSPQAFTTRTAINTQALFLYTLLKGLGDACIICKLYCMLLTACGEEALSMASSIGNQMGLEYIVWRCDTDAIISEFCTTALACNGANTLAQLEAMKHALPVKARHAISVHSLIMKGNADEALTYACDNIVSLRDEQMVSYVEERLNVAFPDHMVPIRLLLCWLRHDKSSIGELLSLLEQNTADGSPEQVKRCLRLVMQAAARSPALSRDVVRWIVGHALEDDRLMCFAEIIEEYIDDLGEPQTIPALFYSCWKDRLRCPQVAARGFGDIAKSKQRVLLSTRLRCINLALEYGPTDSDRLTYVLLLLQDELVKVIERTGQSFNYNSSSKLPRQETQSHVDELRHFYVVESRLFELAGVYRRNGGAKVQMDILKMHPETPERVTVQVLHDLLASLVHEGGQGASEAVRCIVREYYGGYAAGLPLLPFVTFLVHNREDPGTIVDTLRSSGVPAAVVFDTFLHCLDDRCDDTVLTKSGVITALTAAVTNMVGEGRSVYATYLLERIHKLLENEHQIALLRRSDVEQLQNAEAAMMRFVSSSQSVS
ncbi:hypothetical protein, conserved [Trypanosoma brucei gambiense DAL972]|uniref:Uncharacterized protein n=1 Tax=Trypanosoma brucei gambiense (strain MHOM/CI/86/DAL972) TaxID=679716 RepID=D0A8H7_TRYB9|nr:hypothetical protein, conserved [Trypanosoma brucei gambiense DAL972]CBH17978.1 hypothetical protein, conserved [Trypanosoma brucei gambiense DAL972]|eukprot:XP_011780242.1 hypothetical protein, conserved [Trypanosoma brucei gambiense DAL972]